MFDLSKYMTAEERIEMFQSLYPNFRMGSFDSEMEDSKGVKYVKVKVFIYRDYEDQHPWATGLAAELMTTPFSIEKAETSAYARAITNTGDSRFSTRKDGTKAPRANREEMVKVAAAENDKKLVKIEADLANDWESFVAEKPKVRISGGEEMMEFYNEPVKKPITLADGVELIKDGLGAVEVPQCAHGSMERKQGTNKQGKPYAGWVCSSKNRNDQCPAQWDKK